MLRKTLAAAFLIIGSSCFAAEISLLTAGFSSKKMKSPAGDQKQTTFEIGGRFHETYDEHIELYYVGGLTLRSNSQGGDTNGIEIGAGARYYGRAYSNVAKPYIALQAFYKNDEDKLLNTKQSGIFYGGLLGMRFEFTQEYFFDLEGDLFNSALIATESTSAGNTEVETSTTQLRASGRNDAFFNSIKVGVGMKI